MQIGYADIVGQIGQMTNLLKANLFLKSWYKNLIIIKDFIQAVSKVSDLHYLRANFFPVVVHMGWLNSDIIDFVNIFGNLL